ncbi:TonB-dependent receptor [Sphingomonas crocodyli]|uniref:TonB-dependent receptor n=1 Tax=Sphingomonas crocodyli TaxID=1979270 RepID=A0A437M705_9SPHN|nr:TonB-dependent receptor [Sphingomonas crocodyli]RVT93498.1 TonB-dependent receptor [Sphingomonas crocodyli]
MKIAYMGGSSIAAMLAVACLAPAAAQAQTSAPSAEVPTSLDEIVVTARSREEKLLDAPVAVTAITATSIERANLTRATDFIALVPNITIADAQDSGNVSINIRGVGQIRNGETPVAISIDGVLLSSPLQFKQEFFDIQQIEVLRGPQGALYGRNAIAGAINITTKRPTNDFSGNLRVGYGNGDAFTASAAVSGALIDDVLLVRAGISRSQSDGLIRNSFLNKKVDYFEDTTARLRLDWTPTDTVSVDFRGFYSTRKGGAAYFARPLLQASGRPFLDPVPNVDVANDVVAPESNNLGFDDRQLIDFSLKVDVDTAIGTLTSTTAYSNVQHLVAFDGYDYSNNRQCYLFGYGSVSDGLVNCTNPRTFGLGPSGNPNGADVQFPAGYNTTFQDNDIKNWSQEVRLTSPGDQPLRYIAGAYFLWRDRSLVTGTNEDLGFGIIPVLDFDPLTPNQTRRYFAENNKDFAYALFGQINYDVTETVELSLSGRFDSDRRRQTDPRVAPFRVDGFGLPITGPAKREATFKKFQPKGTIRWKPSDQTQVYATAAQGFRSGGFNSPGTEVDPFTGAPISASVYKKEVATSYEVGAKASLLDNMLTLSGAAFITRAKDLQAFNFNGSVNAQIVTNIDRVDITGVELEWTLRPVTSFKVFGSVGFTDAEIKKYAANPAAIGNQVPYTTKLTISSGVEYVAPLSDDYNGVFRADWQRRGKTYFHEGGTFVGVPVRDPINFVSGRIALEHRKGWSIAIWGKNLLNERYYEEVVAPDYNYQGRPRTYGVELAAKF